MIPDTNERCAVDGDIGPLAVLPLGPLNDDRTKGLTRLLEFWVDDLDEDGLLITAGELVYRLSTICLTRFPLDGCWSLGPWSLDPISLRLPSRASESEGELDAELLVDNVEEPFVLDEFDR